MIVFIHMYLLNIWFSTDSLAPDLDLGFFGYGLHRDNGWVGHGARGPVLGKPVGVDQQLGHVRSSQLWNEDHLQWAYLHIF